MTGDDDKPDLTDEELGWLAADWLKDPFGIHPEVLRLLIERFVALMAERAEAIAKTNRRPDKSFEIATVVYRHLWTGGVSLMEAKRRAAAELRISVPAVDQAYRRSGRSHGYGCDINGYPLDPRLPWNKRGRPLQK